MMTNTTPRMALRRAAAVLSAAAALGTALPALAKLPAPSAEAQAKAAETSARTAWATKVEMYQLCKTMDAVAAHYRKQAKAGGKEAPPAVETPPCTDPGAFAYTAPSSAPPLEVSGAHSPAATAVNPPSTNKTAAEIQGTKQTAEPAVKQK